MYVSNYVYLYKQMQILVTNVGSEISSHNAIIFREFDNCGLPPVHQSCISSKSNNINNYLPALVVVTLFCRSVGLYVCPSAVKLLDFSWEVKSGGGRGEKGGQISRRKYF